jgi:pimeloyl-ACP methyl ester carboxylesterase
MKRQDLQPPATVSRSGSGLRAKPSQLAARALMWVSRKLFEGAGYSWEIRRSGDLKLGLWRRKLGSDRSRLAQPRRFVLTPGFADSPSSWQMVIALLSPALRRAGFDEIVLIDFPGFSGRLADEKCYPTMDLLKSAYGDLLDWLEPHTILGHSLGGWLAAGYACACGAGERPKMKRRHGYEGPRQLVLAAPAGVYQSADVHQAVAAIFADVVGEKGFAALRPHLFAKEPLWFGWLAQGFGRFAADPGIRQFTESVREDHLLAHRLGQVRARTWLFWGEHDTLVPTAGWQAWLRGLSAPGCEPEAIVLRGIGHSPQLEKPAVTAALISQMLLGHVPESRAIEDWATAGAQGA